MGISLSRLMSGHHLERRGTALTMLVMLAAVLQMAAGAGLAAVAGLSSVRVVLGDFHWVWLLALTGALGLSFAGYYWAYEGIFTVAGGPTLKGSQMRMVVTVGFGGFLAHGGGALDRYALEAAGTDQREAKVRVSGLAAPQRLSRVPQAACRPPGSSLCSAGSSIARTDALAVATSRG